MVTDGICTRAGRGRNLHVSSGRVFRTCPVATRTTDKEADVIWEKVQSGRNGHEMALVFPERDTEHPKRNS